MHPNLLADPEAAFPLHAPRRVVSLIPSMTGSLYDFGLGEVLVGVSDYCPIFEGSQWNPPRLGGPKTPDLAAIAALQPDLVLANREENSRAGIEALANLGLTVWLTFPLTVRESLDDLNKLARLFRSDTAMRAASVLEKNIEWARMAGQSREGLRFFCPIWEDTLQNGTHWWMTFNSETYPSDLLTTLGAQNVFATRQRRYPLEADLGLAPEIEQVQPGAERDTRYPRITLAEIIIAQPDIILLPDEPYAYNAEHVERARSVFAETPAADAGRIYLVDGSLLMWPGTRMANALEELPRFLDL